MAQDPAVILLDEPTSHLDFGNQIKVLKIIKKMAEDGYGIVFTTHNPDHVLILQDKLAVLNKKGELTFGDSKEIISEDFLRNLYNSQLHLVDVQEVGRKVCVPSIL